ncbi:sigma-70 family RNA polymerase sigma factor [Haloferula sp.]|uniref:sigma-70 family RNA polymerase sigma factor n=1 Tax=Haloferula sp. TaxID=2497595 RepID=UPI003C75F7CF
MSYFLKNCCASVSIWKYPSDIFDQNDQERFMRLWTAHQPSVANYVHALVRDRGTAEDLLQETALMMLRRFTEYDERRSFVAWALGFARFKIMSLRRDSARSILVFDDEAMEQFTESWAEKSVETSAQRSALEGCIEKLAEHARRVVSMRYFEDLNAEEIAGRIGGSGAAVRVKIQRIRAQLRNCIERETRLENQRP